MSRSTRSLAERLRHAARQFARAARLAIGLPDYDAYLAHMRQAHPQCTPRERDGFFRERMQARYGRGRSRCC